jgi:hypothetical protein
MYACTYDHLMYANTRTWISDSNILKHVDIRERNAILSWSFVASRLGWICSHMRMGHFKIYGPADSMLWSLLGILHGLQPLILWPIRNIHKYSTKMLSTSKLGMTFLSPIHCASPNFNGLSPSWTCLRNPKDNKKSSYTIDSPSIPHLNIKKSYNSRPFPLWKWPPSGHFHHRPICAKEQSKEAANGPTRTSTSWRTPGDGGFHGSMAPAGWFPAGIHPRNGWFGGTMTCWTPKNIYSKPWKDRNVDIILHDFGQISLFYLFGVCFCSWIDWYDGFAEVLWQPDRGGCCSRDRVGRCGGRGLMIPWAVHETGEGTTLPDSWNHLVANPNT